MGASFESEAAFSQSCFRNSLVCSGLCPVGFCKCGRMAFPWSLYSCTQLVAVLNHCSCVVNTAGNNINLVSPFNEMFISLCPKVSNGSLFPEVAAWERPVDNAKQTLEV